MKRRFKNFNFKVKTIAMIEKANEILDEYKKDGLRLTLRQLYYQFVSRDLLANTNANYDRLGTIIGDGRLAGEIDWDAIEDRTRGAEVPNTWDSPADIIESAAIGFKNDLWKGQKFRPEIWIEKEALAGVFEQLCRPHRLPYLCCRGYTSLSTMYEESQRLLETSTNGQMPVIIHFGDHDPSGIDMSRDIEERLEMFMRGRRFKFIRAALNMNQIEELQPPPNPAKKTDVRFKKYQELYGDESWELDALDIRYLRGVVNQFVDEYRDGAKWNKRIKIENENRALLTVASGKWNNGLSKYIRTKYDLPEVKFVDDEEESDDETENDENED